jgi:murein DD-endopeptidase MepM/ murein hydrolase activator NlpD
MLPRSGQAQSELQSVEFGWPFPECQTWYVLQGYYSDPHKSHHSSYAFDIMKDSPTSDSTTGLATIIAPMNGKAYEYKIRDGTYGWGVQIVNGAYTFKLNHLEKPNPSWEGQWVNKGDVIGHVLNTPLGGYKLRLAV